MAAASLRNVEIAAAAAEVTDGGGDDNKNNSNRHTSCSGYSNQHTYHQQEHKQPKKRNIYHQTANCHYHTGASILFWLAVILVLGELKTGKFIFWFLHFAQNRDLRGWTGADGDERGRTGTERGSGTLCSSISGFCARRVDATERYYSAHA